MDKLVSALAHLSPLICLLGVPFGDLLAPVVFLFLSIMFFSGAVDAAKESLNFQLSITIYSLGLLLLTWLVFPPAIMLVMAVMGLFNIFVRLVATFCVLVGDEPFEYPICLRMIK